MTARFKDSPQHDGKTAAAVSPHLVQFYDEDAFLVEAAGRFIATALEAGDAGVVIATKEHRDCFAEALAARGFDIIPLSKQGHYIALDAAETLSHFMVDGSPDETRFARVVGQILTHAATTHQSRRVCAFGEMVALLYADGRQDAAIRLEELWNNLAKKIRFSLFCAYPIDAFRQEAHSTSFLRICAEHANVIPAESFTGLSSRDEQLRAVSHLQQKASVLETETAERRKAETSLYRTQQELSDFLENAVEGLQQIGPDGRVLWANSALLKLLGYSAEEYISHHLAEFYARHAAFDEMWRRLMRRETLYDYPAELRCKDGSIKHVIIHSNGLWENGRFLSTRCFIRDVTEQHRLQEALQERLEQLADADRRKDEFLAMLGHELRNPLSAIRNALATADLDGSQRERALAIARRQTDQLGRLVDDLLDAARIAQRRIRLRVQPVRFASIVERAVETARPLVEARSHTVATSLSCDDAEVGADAARLEQVIVNLISNAARFTHRGGRIEIATARQGSEVVLRIRDNGIGITAEMLPHVFDLFAQADGTLDRTDGGLGVGLTVARRIVELHDGHIEGHSDGLGKGAEFVVRLPTLPSVLDRPDAAAPQVAHATKRDRILIVEDNPDAGESLGMLLELLGHHVQVVCDGAAALATARADVPDVMVVDIGLPEMDGYEVARRVRRDPILKNVRLVALTGYGREEDRQQALTAGFDYHLVKPVDVNALRSIVARFRTSDAGTGTPPTLH